jgi:uncharacterized protein YbjT (DUF2867 family)
MGRKALLLGATGLIGKELLHLLLAENEYEQVNIIVRNGVDIHHPKLNTVIDNLDSMDSYEDMFKVDDIYCCLGTTIKKAGTRENFQKVDLDYPLQAARLGLKQGASKYLVVSAIGADENSPFFYSRVKGRLEEGLTKMGFESVIIFRPSLLLGKREEVRIGEKAAELVSVPLGFLFKGKLRKYRPVQGEAVASMMLAAALLPGKGIKVFESIGTTEFEKDVQI